MCLNCIKSQVDITDGITKSETIFFCRECERYLQPPKYWIKCDLESKELLTLCLKRIHGLNRVKLIDAKFLWTEPHSKRLKVKVTIQKEVLGNGTVLQQSFVVEFIVRNQQCEVCQKSHTLYTWNAVVQVRQKLDHKRTFLFLEQLILKHNVHEKAINIKEEADGLDFFFSEKSHAKKLVDFLQSVSPIKLKTGERLVTHDAKSNTFNFKYSFSLEIAPICREDLICLPKRLSTSMGGIGPLVLCTKVNKNLFFIDPTTLQTSELDGSLYWRQPFTSTLTSRQLSEFTVIDVELLDYSYFAKNNNNNMPAANGKYVLCEVQIVRSDEMNMDPIFVKSHLGNLLHPGDTVLCYDLRKAQYDEGVLSEYKNSQTEKLPEAIIVKKVYKKRRDRNWELKTLASEKNFNNPNVKDEGPQGDDVVMKKKSANKKAEKLSGNEKLDQKRKEKDVEEFYQELEEDKEMRSKINIFKSKKKQTSTTNAVPSSTLNQDENDESSDSEDEFAPGIADEELLDEEEYNKMRAANKLEEEDDQDDINNNNSTTDETLSESSNAKHEEVKIIQQ
ncbi:hypothetical protein C9374_008933 [Naegleria lovaniensis]|uniref:60S ribosomal export protein NMD3 n=1 Tax=Naegleria lovaniensis TaxID=51637 RepID=A0AA88KHI0_NAELO|nr:uncharacterized protein C9374_008933 [Naegleria lovaniensis]KAG2377848.1 hypothetical protein C9374_008933 [Naegleria lovaniensis]